MKLNKKGFTLTPLGVILIWHACLWTNVIISQQPAVKDAFRHRKAVEFCVADLNTPEDCEEIVSSMSKDAILDYIRDDEPAPEQPVNQAYDERMEFERNRGI